MQGDIFFWSEETGSSQYIVAVGIDFRQPRVLRKIARRAVSSIFKRHFLADPYIKQFVVTKCSKERPGSIVTKTLKNRILMPEHTSKESHFNADFKYISFIKFSLTHQKLRA